MISRQNVASEWLTRGEIRASSGRSRQASGLDAEGARVRCSIEKEKEIKRDGRRRKRERESMYVSTQRVGAESTRDSGSWSALCARWCERARMRLHRHRGLYTTVAPPPPPPPIVAAVERSKPPSVPGLLSHSPHRHPLLLIVFPLCLPFLWPRHFYCLLHLRSGRCA